MRNLLGLGDRLSSASLVRALVLARALDLVQAEQQPGPGVGRVVNLSILRVVDLGTEHFVVDD